MIEKKLFEISVTKRSKQWEIVVFLRIAVLLWEIDIHPKVQTWDTCARDGKNIESKSWIGFNPSFTTQHLDFRLTISTLSNVVNSFTVIYISVSLFFSVEKNIWDYLHQDWNMLSKSARKEQDLGLQSSQ